MIESCACERIGVVAILAFVARLRMIRGLSNRLDPVMAADAALRCAGMIEPVDDPLPGRVAGVAFGLRDYMVCGFAIGPHVVVATSAVAGRSLEDRTLVASFARDGHMRSS